MQLYKVLRRNDGKLLSPFQSYEYRVGERYDCADKFDTDKSRDCSTGYYATDIDGLIYSFRNLPGYEVWLCEVGGKSVEVDQFKRRYETIKLIKHIPDEKVKSIALDWEEKVGYKLTEALFPVNPFKIQRDNIVTEKEVELLRQWDSVWASVRDSVWASVGASVRASVWASVGGYISSLFSNIKKWKHINHPEGENPFQPCIDLWHRGLVPSFDGKKWRLHAGEKAEIVWEGVI